MKLPKSLRIGGHTIQVVVTDDVEELDMGDYNADLNRIRIRKSLAPSKKGAILLHEILHALNNTFGADENSDDHRLLDSLAEQLYQVLTDNKLKF